MLPRTCTLMLIAAVLVAFCAPALADPINSSPVADANGPYTGTVGVALWFDGSGSWDPNPTDILTYTWDFGDGGSGAGITPWHTYGSAGTYTIWLTVADDQGGVATTNGLAIINAASPPPIPEPGSLALVGLAGLGLIWLRRRRR